MIPQASSRLGPAHLVVIIAVVVSHLGFFSSPAAPASTTHTVASLADWNRAVAESRPGDTIRLTATIRSRLQYRGNNDGAGTQTGLPGTASAPITITSDPGVWIDPGNRSNNFGALDILGVDHVHVVGVRVRNSQFGIRFMQVNGTANSPVRVAGNLVEDIGHAGIYFGGHWRDHAPSSHGLIEGNTVRRTGLSAAQYGEGVYLGHGGTEWVDRTSNVVVRSNDISNTGAEGVDIKPGTANIVVEDNYLHDISPVSGGAISAHYVNVDPNPQPSRLDQVTIRNNSIWNINLDGRRGANDWPIWVGHGGIDITGNHIWGLRADASRVRPIRIRALQPFGPHPIRIEDNVFWTAQTWMAEGSPSGAGNVVARGNLGFTAGSGTQQVPASHFPGPIPAIGTGGTADNGGGPGSGFRLGLPSARVTPPTSTTSPPADPPPAAPSAPATQPSAAPPATVTSPATSAAASRRSSTTTPNPPTSQGAATSSSTATFGTSGSTTNSSETMSDTTGGLGERDLVVDSIGGEETRNSGLAFEPVGVPGSQQSSPGVDPGDRRLDRDASNLEAGAGVNLEAPDALAFNDLTSDERQTRIFISDPPGRNQGSGLFMPFSGALGLGGLGLFVLLFVRSRARGRTSEW